MALHTVAPFKGLPEDRGTEVKLGTLRLVLLRQGDQVFAYQGLCPHAGAPLAEGAVCQGRLVCPWHKASFSVASGALCEPPALDDLRRYPARVVNGQVQVDDQPLPRPICPPIMDDRVFAIVGAGAAGVAAAAALRDNGFNGRLLLIDGQPQPCYDRTALSKFVLAGDMAPDDVPPLREPEFFQQQRIGQVHARVNQLEVSSQRLTLSDGQFIHYDRALLATGGEPQPLPIPGGHLPQVLQLRSRADAARVLELARPGARAVIIGESFIGLESASALRKHEVAVTLLARKDVPFVKQFGEAVGKALKQLHEDNGVAWRSGAQAASFAGEHHLEAVVLKNRERIAADFVLLGIGVHPATDIIKGLALNDDGSLQVDEHLRAAPGLWAAGDIARFPLAGQPQRIEHWRLAQQHGRAAAMDMLDKGAAYADVPYFWTYHYGKRIDYLGHAAQWDQLVAQGDPQHFEFIQLQCMKGVVTGAVACNFERSMAALAQRMRQPLGVDEALAIVRNYS
jgi:NADPH-dependent 2,4-dienoyl-CoA reductase/sulfur reductase-like enzyme/nitrite reductase/ring-hydroxylating ferredoxin subunit